VRFWNSAALVQEFRNGKMNSRDKVGYLILFVTFWSLLDLLPLLFPATVVHKNKGLTWELLSTFTVLGGILWCHDKNRRVDDKEFLDRFVALGFVNGIRTCIWAPVYTVLMIGMLAILRPVWHTIGIGAAKSQLESDLQDFLFIFPVTFFWFFSIRRNICHIGRTATPAADPDPTSPVRQF
jgi:hypothetical protein